MVTILHLPGKCWISALVVYKQQMLSNVKYVCTKQEIHRKPAQYMYVRITSLIIIIYYYYTLTLSLDFSATVSADISLKAEPWN